MKQQPDTLTQIVRMCEGGLPESGSRDHFALAELAWVLLEGRGGLHAELNDETHFVDVVLKRDRPELSFRAGQNVPEKIIFPPNPRRARTLQVRASQAHNAA